MNRFKGSVILLLSIATVILVAMMLKSSPQKTSIISVKKVHTYLYTSNLETFQIEALINKEASHVFLEEAIDRVYITNVDDSQKIPVTLTSVKAGGTRLFNEQSYHHVTLFMKPALKTDDLTTHINDALLTITYRHFPEVSLPIGSFSYSFLEPSNTHVTLETRINIPQLYHTYPTSMGLYFNLRNKTSDPITITNISLLSDHITPNLDEVIALEAPTHDISYLTSRMPVHYNPLAKISESPSPLVLFPYEESFYLIPFSYKEALYLSLRYPIMIDYTYQGTAYTNVYDDFLFINTDLFLTYQDAVHHEVIYDYD